jgi:nucleoside-diphosphate-sugar epimerase
MVSPIKILIIGIDSFTGRHLRAFFEKKGYEVFGTSQNTLENQNIFFADILNFQSLIDVLENSDPHYIINLAAISFVGEPKKELFYNVNVLGAENILKAIDQVGLRPKKILFPSSAVVYGDQKSNTLAESFWPNPKNHYGYSKFVMEQICKTYMDRHNVIVTRPFNYTGIGQADTFLVPKIVNAFREKSKSISLGNIKTLREYNDVNFICESYLKLLESDFRSGIVNICTGITYSVEDILVSVSEITGYEIDLIIDQNLIRRNEIFELKGDPAILNSLIGDIGKSYSLENMLKRMLKSDNG